MEIIKPVLTSQQKKLNIKFTGFWPGFDPTDNFFYNLLCKNYEVAISEQPDLLFFSIGNTEHMAYNCTKIFYTGENIGPDFLLCDFAFTYRETTTRNYRLPLYALYHDVNKMVKRATNAELILREKRDFCCFIVSNGACETRNDFFKKLSAYKPVASGGRFLNNIGYEVNDKNTFIRNYKFVIAFENTSFPGYTTEKIYEPLVQHSVPIYWGDPLVKRDFNPKAFINSHDYASFDKVVERVIEVDQDNELYMQYLREPVFTGDLVNKFVDNSYIQKRLDEIVAYHFEKGFKLRQKIRPCYIILLSGWRKTSSTASKLLRMPSWLIRKISS